jgi:hypothetical protein
MIYDPNLPPSLRPHRRDDPEVPPDRRRPMLSHPYPQYMLVPIQPIPQPHVLPPNVVPPPGPIYLPGMPPGGGPAGPGFAVFPQPQPGLQQVQVPLYQPPMPAMQVPPPMPAMQVPPPINLEFIPPQPPQGPQNQ